MTSPTALEYGIPYHIFTRGVNRENIFFEEGNYHHFMELFGYHVTPVADIFAYCLLGNHFHLFLRVRTKTEIKKAMAGDSAKKKLPLPFPGQCVGNLLNAYAKSINYVYRRTGSLFQHPFGRIPVTSTRYFEQLMKYIHQNPQHHGLVTDFRDWPYSSFHVLDAKEDEGLIGPIPVTRIQEPRRSARVRAGTAKNDPIRPLIFSDFF